uniref:Uncharacterized protein n=1 Tax=Anguilla anguilla TaxID=7936 RepID=A0A0E9VT75_ANGAN
MLAEYPLVCLPCLTHSAELFPTPHLKVTIHW